MASDVLQRCMRALPRQRNALLLGMAAFTARLPEDFPEARCHLPAQLLLSYPLLPRTLLYHPACIAVHTHFLCSCCIPDEDADPSVVTEQGKC
jgi:hypothetical protein